MDGNNQQLLSHADIIDINKNKKRRSKYQYIICTYIYIKYIYSKDYIWRAQKLVHTNTQLKKK